MFGFELGREFKLSIAEILSAFKNKEVFFVNKKILILSGISKDEILEKSKFLGGTIKIFEILGSKNTSENHKKDIEEIFLNDFGIEKYIGKFNYGVNIFGNTSLKTDDLLKVSKNAVKSFGLNPRFLNHDKKNLSSIVIIKEALIKKETDFNFLFVEDKLFFGKTIFVQDIYSYSNRDYSKSRDMNVGMLPPKLAQMMINLGNNFLKKDLVIYDPFVGLGTVLIESVYMGNKLVFGSDKSESMVSSSTKNLEKLLKNFKFDFKIIKQNAKYINEVDFLDKVDLIVSEGFLGEIMTKNNISIERIDRSKKILIDLYISFFENLKKVNYKNNIVISFPFWDIKGKYLFFDEVYDIIKKDFLVINLLENNTFQSTKEGSLLYKRDSQLVGREIFLLKLK
ncbi:hypothetical protein H3C61_00015 [Candidatus Gracilibacteria bacterium]|nr:hypothetical protein [Candidatus Gracilibacteria bacterium]